jgi:phospholipid-binding lipoprotein MlaA
MRRAAATLLVALVLGACAATPGDQLGSAPPRRELPEVPPDFRSALDVDDPFETFNRGVYWFNTDLDRKILLPVVDGYKAVTPEFLRERVSSFFTNLGEIRNATNGLLQLRPEVASRAVMRFLVNSTVGLLGTFDVAGELGMTENRQDFGLTLGRWGVGAGPYLVLPVIGPSGLRDAGGTAVDLATGLFVPPGAQINDLVYANPAVYGVQAVDARYQVNFRYFDSGSPFEYEIVRFFYTRKRELDLLR